MRDRNESIQYRYKNKNKNRNRNRVSKRNKYKEQKEQSIKATITIKLKQVFLPYLGLSILTIILFGALRWVLDIYLDVLPLKEDYWNFSIPCLLSILVVSIWMWPRYESLNLKWAKRSSSSYFFLTMTLAIAVPLVISQNYLSKASYEVIPVDSLDNIRDYPKQKYFSIDDYELLKSDHVSYVDSSIVSSSYDSDLNVYYYFATPFYNTDNVWLGSYYYTSFDNRAAESIKDRRYSEFIDDSRYRYETQNFSNINYFKKLKSSNERSGYLHAIKKSDEPDVSPPLVLVPETGLFVDSLERNLVWGFGSFAIGMGLCLLLILAANIDDRELKVTQEKVKKKVKTQVKKSDPVSNVSKDLVALFRKNKKRPATLVLMLACIGAFILTVFMGMNVFAPLSSQINEAGGLTTDALQAGKHWRVLTSLFVHVGIMHLVMSLFMLFVIGYILEPVLGAVRFTVVFFICGICSNILGVLYYDINMAGSYNAILGLFGFAIALIACGIFNKHQRQWYGIIIIIFLGINIISMFASFINHLNYIGYHLLTLLIGIVLGFIVTAIQRPTFLNNAKRIKNIL